MQGGTFELILFSISNPLTSHSLKNVALSLRKMGNFQASLIRHTTYIYPRAYTSNCT